MASSTSSSICVSLKRRIKEEMEELNKEEVRKKRWCALYFPAVMWPCGKSHYEDLWIFQPLHAVDEWCQCLLLTQSGDPKRRPHWRVWNAFDWTCVVAEEWGGPLIGHRSDLMRQRRTRRGGTSLSRPFGNTHPYLQLFLSSLSFFPSPFQPPWLSVTQLPDDCIVTKWSKTKPKR